MTDEPGAGRPHASPPSWPYAEAAQYAIALALGLVVAMALLGGIGQRETWRVIVLPVALLLIIRALLRLLQLGRAEWRRERTAARSYLGVVARFVLAYLIVVAASS